MNSKLKTLLLLPLMALTIASCSESSDDENTEYQDWQARNESYFEQIYQTARQAIDEGSSEWIIIKNFSKSDGLDVYTPGTELSGSHSDCVVVQVKSQKQEHNELTGLTSSSGQLFSPIYTDTVSVSYKGNLMPSASYEDGYRFSTSWYGSDYDESTAVIYKFAVSGLTEGFATALQRMHVGDRWIVYVPYQLGYGSTDNSSIPAYSMLRFDIILKDYCHARMKK